MGPGYLRELEGVVYRHAHAGLMLSPSESSPPRIHPSILASNSNEDDDDPTARTSTPITTAATAQAQEPPPPPPVALLVSESAFTRNCLLAAHASPLPFLLVHLPSQSSGDGGGSAIGAVFGNPALVSAKGVLGGELEIRWEHGGGVPLSASSLSSSSSSGVLGSGCPRLWWQGQPLPSWTPDADGVVLDQR